LQTLPSLSLHLDSFLGADQFQIVYSRHVATNNQILIPKVKAGFVITGIEVLDVFGVMVHLSYFFNPLRRKVLDARVGKPDLMLKSSGTCHLGKFASTSVPVIVNRVSNSQHR
jgi:hypothetical protein